MSVYVSVCLSIRPSVRSFVFRMYVYECVCVREYERTCVNVKTSLYNVTTRK